MQYEWIISHGGYMALDGDGNELAAIRNYTPYGWDLFFTVGDVRAVYRGIGTVELAKALAPEMRSALEKAMLASNLRAYD